MAYDFLPIEDFSGGLTDYPKDGIINECAELKNLILTKDKGMSTRWGSEINDATANRTINGENPDKIIEKLDGTKLICSGEHLYYIDSTVQELFGPTSNVAFNEGTSSTTKYDYIEWQDQLIITNDSFTKPVKVYKDGSGDLQLRTAGLPALATTPTVTKGAAGAGTYTYGFLYQYSYYVGTVLYEDYGFVATAQITSAAAPDATTVAITAIPVLANGTTLNYDTVNMKVQIYRTIDGGVTFYYEDEVTNGTTTYSSTTSDTALLANNVTLYTTGGVVDNGAPPLAKYVIIANKVAYYLGIKEGSEEKGFRILQAIASDVDSVPANFKTDLDEDITGGGVIENTPIVFTKNKTYKITSFIDELGRGDLKLQLISSTKGCVSNDSIIQTDRGLLFAGNRGWMYTDGYQVMEISERIDKTYKTLVSTDSRAKQIHGAYDAKNRLAFWGVQENDSSDQNDSIYVFHEEFGIKPNGAFSRWSNGAYFSATSLLLDQNGDLIRGDWRGYLLKHNDTYKNDPKVVNALTPAEWSTKEIVYDWTSSELFTKNKGARKYGSKVMVRAENIDNFSCQPMHANDGFQNFSATEEIRRRQQLEWEVTPEVDWEEDSGEGYLWEMGEDINEIRYLSSDIGLRYYTKQLKLTNSFTVIQASDIFGTATIDATAKTITLDGSYEWQDNADGFAISLPGDDYQKRYYVTERTSATVLKLADPDDALVNGSTKWVLRGIPKNERAIFVMVILYYSYGNENFTPYDSTGSGENASD